MRALCRTTSGATRVSVKSVRAILWIEHALTPPGSWVPDQPILTDIGLRFMQKLRTHMLFARLIRCEGYTATWPPSPAHPPTLSLNRAKRVCSELKRTAGGTSARVSLFRTGSPIRLRRTRTRPAAASTVASSSPSCISGSSAAERGTRRCETVRMHGLAADPAALRRRVEEHIRAHGLIPPGGEVVALVSGGADSTCLWHALGALGYRVSALHVNHGLRGAESDADASFCRDVLGAEVVDGRGGTTEDDLRRIRYSFAADRLRATGHTASDQVETVLYRLVSSGAPGGIKPKREDGVVRPLLPLWREETQAYCEAEGLAYRTDSSNPETRRGLIRDEILPLLRRLHPGAEKNLLRLAEGRPSKLDDLLAATTGSRRVDLGGGLTAVREYDRVWLEQTPVALEGRVRWGEWTIESELTGLKVRSWRPGDRLAGRSKKVQDVFVDAKIPRSEREAWPLVVRGRDVVAVPGLVEAPGITAERR